MTPPRPHSANMDFARALIVELGVSEWLLCPGSRSGPLAHALAEAARGDAPEGAPALDLHVRVDERAAAFTALGLCRGGAPAAVATTSGTAVGNLLPAAMEARHAGLPLLLITADRPFWLRGTGANQTTDQRGVFGAFATTLDVPPPRPDQDVRALAASVARRARDILESGPAHLNLQFAEPLGWAAGRWPGQSGQEGPGASGGSPGGPPLPVLPEHERGVVVAGDGAGAFAWRLARARGWPLLAEPTSLARVEPVAVPRYQALLSSDEGAALAARAEVVVTVGRPTLSRQVRALVEGAPRLWAVLPGPLGWAPLNAQEVIPGPDDAWWRAVDPHLVPAAPSLWSEAWQAAAAALPPDPAPAGWSVEAVAAEVCRRLPAGVPLVAGSSRAVRALDAVMPAAPAEAVRRVIANRGLAGIDGTVSTAMGVALGCRDGWALALMGDLTFLHDAGGLLIGPRERRPDLRIVVLNDGGGTIFSGLEHAGADRAAFNRVFTTPHGADIGALCAGYGVGHTPVRSVAELSEALAGRPGGVQVVEALLA